LGLGEQIVSLTTYTPADKVPKEIAEIPPVIAELFSVAKRLRTKAVLLSSDLFDRKDPVREL